MPEIYLGVDCAVQGHHFSLLVDGEEQESFRVANREEDLRERLLEMRRKGEVHLVVESLFGFSRPLISAAQDLGLVISQVNPKALSHFRDLEGYSNKTDRIDAFLLARMGCLKMKGCRLAVHMGPAELELRRLTRFHRQVTAQHTEQGQLLRSRYVEMFPEIYDEEWKGPKPTSAQFFKVMMRWPGFLGLAKAKLQTIENVLKGGPLKKERRREQAEALKALARSLAEPSEVEVFELRMMLAQKELLSAHLKEIRKQLDQTVKAHPIARKLMEMPGIGPVVAGTLVAEVFPLIETSTEGQIATYCGLTPVARRSGKSGRDKFRRGSNKHALHACFMSATASLRFSAMDNAYYQKQKKRHQGHPKPHVVATLALARQRMKVMYKLMKTDARYDKEILLRSHLERVAAKAA